MPRGFAIIVAALPIALSSSCCRCQTTPAARAAASPLPAGQPGATSPVGTAPSADFDARFRRARDIFLRAVQGNEEMEGPAREAIRRLAEERPGDPLINAYLGSSRLLEARAESLPWRKGELCNEGLAILDAAVEAAPEDLEVRFVRGISSMPLPFFFGRGTLSREDIEWVARRAGDAVGSGRLEPFIGAAALYEQGLILEAAADAPGARASWSAAAEMAPESYHAAAARKKLEELAES